MRGLSLAVVSCVHLLGIAAVFGFESTDGDPQPEVLMRASLVPAVRAKPLPVQKPKPTDAPKAPKALASKEVATADTVQTVTPDQVEEASEPVAGSMEHPMDANYRVNPAPSYPNLSRRLKEEGRVLLKVHVAADGLPVEIILHESSGFERLDRAAINAVHNWQFEPAQHDGQAVTSWVLVPIQFRLRGS